MRRSYRSDSEESSGEGRHLEVGMPVNNLWGIDRRDVWRTCFCFHVRTVTIFIGVWHMMIYILALSFVAAMVMYENDHAGMMTPKPEDIPLPTPQSKFSSEGIFTAERQPKLEPLTIDRTYGQEAQKTRIESIRSSSPWTFGMDARKANSQVILLTVCNMIITLLMVYGAVRGKPSYLMPFFVLKVFDFCIFCLTMVGYFSYLPDLTQLLINQPVLPFRDELLRMDPQLLSLLTLILIVGTIAVKAYIIGIIWNCYKYLMLRNTVIRGVIAYRHDDPTNIIGLQQNLLPDLPDYETAVNDPRYAKKPPLDGTSVAPSSVSMGGGNGIPMPPPPPYSVAIGSEPISYIHPASLTSHPELVVVPTVVNEVHVEAEVPAVVTHASPTPETQPLPTEEKPAETTTTVEQAARP